MPAPGAGSGGAYLEETRCGLSQYLELSRSRQADLLRHRGGVALDHPDPVATTWSLSFALIEQRSALAADLLRQCAVLHPDSIPEALFLQAAVHLGPTLTPPRRIPSLQPGALVIRNYSSCRATVASKRCRSTGWCRRCWPMR